MASDSSGISTRVTAAEVKEIMDLSSSNIDDVSIESFIESASALLDSTLEGTVTEPLLTEIEKWVAAHLIALTPFGRMSKKESAGSASIEYEGETGKGMQATFYGQTAVELDVSGKLKSLGKQRVYFLAVNAQ